jgi:hypothetical protein
MGLVQRESFQGWSAGEGLTGSYALERTWVRGARTEEGGAVDNDYRTTGESIRTVQVHL